MSTEVSVEAAKKNLDDILAKMSPGEATTLIGPGGKPMALLVSMKPSCDEVEEKKWDEEWEALGREIDKAWKSEKSVLEILSEMRR